MVDRRTMLVREPVVDVVGAVMDYRRAVTTGQYLAPVPGEVR
jgi:hypothetical protein